MTAPKTPDQWASEQMRAAVDALPKCGHIDCMNRAVLILSMSMLVRVGSEISTRLLSSELVSVMASLGAAHQQLHQMQVMARADKGTMQ